MPVAFSPHQQLIQVRSPMGCIGGDLSGSLVMSNSQLRLGVEHEAKLPPKHGIVSILGSDSSARPAASLRRTLSADMLSKSWLSQNGFISNMKKIASSEELSRCISPSSAGEEEEEYDQVPDEKKETPAEELDIWSLIVSQSKNNKDQDKSAAPYIHPLVKKSAGALSKTSLEVCTESLGSETGSDGFSSHPASEMGDAEEEQPQEQQQSVEYEDVRVVKYNFTAVGKKLPPPSFPPPLASLSSRGDEPSLRMMSRRENGRLVLEAVSVSKQNNFKAERQDGRLVLTFANSEPENYIQDPKEEGVIDEIEEYLGQTSDEDEEEEYDDYETEDEEEDETEETEEEGTNRGREIKLHRLALMMNKSASLATMNNPTCPHHNYNQLFQFHEDDETHLAKTLPPVSRLVPAAAGSLNAYDYCWRDKPTAAQAMEKNSDNKHMITKNNSSIIANNDELVMINYIVPNLKGCKEQRRSLFREPYCIAT